jgi:hypothetical protein
MMQSLARQFPGRDKESNMAIVLNPDISYYGAARMVINGRKCSFNSVRSYTLYNNAVYGESKDPEAAVASELAKPGAQIYWINLSSIAICADPGFYEREAAEWAGAPLLSVGDIVEFEGKQFEIKAAPNNNFRPAAI